MRLWAMAARQTIYSITSSAGRARSAAPSGRAPDREPVLRGTTDTHERVSRVCARRGLRRLAMMRLTAPPMETPPSVTSRRSRTLRKLSTDRAKKSVSYRAFGMSE